jgi:hypothetical protein
METPTYGIKGELDAATGVLKEESCKLQESPGTTIEIPS